MRRFNNQAGLGLVGIILLILAVSCPVLLTLYYLSKSEASSSHYCDYKSASKSVAEGQLGWADPLIFDLNLNGIKISSLEGGVLFDINNDSFREQTSWVQEDGFLVLDENKNNIIDNQSEIFLGQIHGKYPHSDNPKQLKNYDSNQDCVLNNIDPIWEELRIWVDTNYDGFTNKGELKKLEAYNITQIPVNYDTREEIKRLWEEYAKTKEYNTYYRRHNPNFFQKTAKKFTDKMERFIRSFSSDE